MKAIVVRQPWATLIALGIKTIETRPAPPNGPMRPEGVRGLPGCSLERGERIAIVAGARAGTEPGEDLGGSGWYWESTAGDISCVVNWKHPVRFHDAPLGAVVCTVRVDDALPIVRFVPKSGRDNPPIPSLDVVGDSLSRWWHHDGGFELLTDQLPLGDFTPGRWGWMLSDPQPPREWHCEGLAVGVCEAGYCSPDNVIHHPPCGWLPSDPIPCKGRQGVFELPDEIAEALS